jgi:phenylacetate-CoA ligase
MDAAGRVYAGLPTPLQHLATAAYGWRVQRLRRGGVYRATRRELARSERWDAARLAEHQQRCLRETVQHAFRATRYWPELGRRLGIDADGIRCVDDLKRLPLLEKATLVERTADLRAAGVPDVAVYFTGGTSGTTLAIPIDAASRQRNYAFFARALAWAGVEDGRSATFAGRPIVPSDASQPRSVWRWNPAMRNRLFSSYHISASNAPAYSRALVAFAPDYVDSYPSALATLAGLFREQGLPAPRPRSVITSSETLLDAQRAVIAEVFGARCFDQYGCTEQAVYVSQCEAGAYHAHPEYGILEVLDAQGKPAAPGVPGEVVCTSFTNAAFPLLRYRIGDVAAVAGSACGCGRAFPVIEQLCGRLDDLIVTPDGRRVGRLDPVFKGRRTIREAQIVQETARDLAVRLVPGPGYADADGEAIAHALRERLGHEMRISILRVASIERTSSGKFRAVINRCAADGAPRGGSRDG